MNKQQIIEWISDYFKSRGYSIFYVNDNELYEQKDIFEESFYDNRNNFYISMINLFGSKICITNYKSVYSNIKFYLYDWEIMIERDFPRTIESEFKFKIKIKIKP